jgi:predicted O-methyltransferase YrrM
MVRYALDHLTQPEDQRVIGPIQDDEALVLYSIIRCSRLRRVLEIGGLSGYSAANFLAAVSQSGPGSVVYTIDNQPSVPVLGPNHRVIFKDARDVTASELDGEPVDLVFFDCHDIVQMDIYARFVSEGIINDNTLLALHDTNLHYDPLGLRQGAIGIDRDGNEGYAHQPVERCMVNMFKDMGYDVMCLHTTPQKHHDGFPFRHGLTVCNKHKPLAFLRPISGCAIDLPFK